jgi:predicted porin
MKNITLLLAATLGFSSTAWAVYAPIPEADQGKNFTASVKGGVTYDSNIFGAGSAPIDSLVINLAPKLDYNASVTDQTFASLTYGLSLDHFTERPGSKDLASHSIVGRVAHQFTKATTIDLTDSYSIQHNPEALLAGLPVNSDQSSRNNEINGTFTTTAGPKVKVTAKTRIARYQFDNAKLGDNLDRAENLFGMAAGYEFLPELSLSGEYRHQVVDYRSGGATKDKQSNYFMGGANYEVAEKVSASGRLGFERRTRSSERGTTVPFAELTGKYDYAKGSYVSAGFVYTLEEASNVVNYTDTEVNRYFVNVQHALTAAITASASLTYEPSKLRGRRGFASADDRTIRAGTALTWTAKKNWSASLTYDFDGVASDDTSRDMHRSRWGVGGVYTF